MILVAWVLLTTLGLLNCGSGSHSVTSGSGSYPTTFAYLQGSYTGVPGPRIPNLTVDLGSGALDLYVMDASTGISTKVNPQSAEFGSVQLSADGSKLLFTARDSEACTEIYMADAKFQTLTQLTQYFVGSPCFDHSEAALSSDGTMIAFAYAGPNASVSTIPAVGGTITPILYPGVPGSVVDVAIDPVFTPDGKNIVFRGYPLGSGVSYILYCEPRRHRPDSTEHRLRQRRVRHLSSGIPPMARRSPSRAIPLPQPLLAKISPSSALVVRARQIPRRC